MSQLAESQLARRLKQAAERAGRMDGPVASRFVAGMERQLALHAAREAGVSVSFSGGWDEAERVQACFHPQWVEADFTCVWVEIRWAAKFARAEHRDLMGSLMALGIDRDYFGDLIAQEDHAYLCALPEAAARLPVEWDKAGSVPLKVRLMEEPPHIDPPRGETLRDTVPSLRLDAVLASGMKASRTRAAEMIRAGLVSVDHAVEERTDRVLGPGQLLSVRGFGRIRLLEVGDRTRKDRLPVQLEIFRKNR